jgi:hypothetical protein
MKKIIVVKKATTNAKPANWCPWLMDETPSK